MTAYKSYDDYVKRIRNKNERLDYKTYVKEQLANAEEEYLGALSGAKAGAISSKPTYGQTAERLAGAGLSGGGYAEYLGGVAEERFRSAVSEATKKRDREGDNMRKSYEGYLRAYTAAQEKLFSNVVSNMSDGTLTDYDTLLEYASTAGLSHDYAKRAAQTARETVINKLRLEVIGAINEDGYAEEESYEYAIKLGLGEDMAKELAEYAKKMRLLKLSGDYLDKIKNEITKENNK